jgi:acyl-CoA synthetase (AMP-forming)/AMP-acid ligase II
MNGLMQERPLLISDLIEYAARWHGDTPVVSRLSDGSLLQFDYQTIAQRSRQLANALATLGLPAGASIGTLAWNTHRHLELYYAVSGSGMVCHTINPRLYYEQIAYIANHGDDQAMFFDVSFIDIAVRLARDCPAIRHWIVLGGERELAAARQLPAVLAYESLIAAASAQFHWPQLAEQTAASLCYTSGTTGDPKGVLYSHRSTVLHAYAIALPDAFGVSASDTLLPASSMYHANGWAAPYMATLTGARLVLPGSQLDGESLYNLIESERVTLSCGVPTVWLGLAQYLERTGLRLSTLKRLTIGGAAVPSALAREYRERHGVEVRQLWGMTETSPLGTAAAFKSKHQHLEPAQLEPVRASQGRPICGIDLRIVAEDGTEQPHDGIAFGNLLVRGGWVAERYFKAAQSALDAEGWFATGDVSTIDPDGYMRITDRSKDLIKSGGEWISSIDLENAAVGHPAVAEAAVIGIAHEKWTERPLLILVLKEARSVTREEMLQFLQDKVARWWLPDDVVVVKEIPHTATGKILKTRLRELFRDHQL